MSETTPEFFRDTLNRFKAADALLSSETKLHDEAASAKQTELTRKAEAVEQIAEGCVWSIQSDEPLSNLSDSVQISPEIDRQLEALRDLAKDIKQQQKSLSDLNGEIHHLKERHLIALSEEKRTRHRKILSYATLAVVLMAAAVFLHFKLLDRTVLSFTSTLDGKPLSLDKKPTILLDGKPFSSGTKIGLGHHHLSITLENAEPLDKEFTAFYGAKDLGALPLESSKGNILLSAVPADAQFELSKDGEAKKNGTLPAQVQGLPVGTYQVIAQRKDWKITNNVSISRNATATNIIEFAYGTLEVTSAPTGLKFLVNGAEAGSTPATLHDIKPGEYALTIIDGENSQNASVTVDPRGTARQGFVFHYGALQLSTTPSGATVIRKGKEIGKTPLMLDHVLASGDEFQFQLAGYADTNVTIRIEGETTTKHEIKLVSFAYIKAMKQAQEALEADNFADAKTFVTAALAADAGNSDALALQNIISETATKAEADRLEAERKKEAARKEAERNEIVTTIEKAISAVGGRDAIKQFKFCKGVSDIAGTASGKDFNAKITAYYQLPNRVKVEQELANPPKQIGILTITSNGGQPIRTTYCVTERNSWQFDSRFSAQAMSLPTKLKEKFRHSLYIVECFTLVPLLRPEYTLEKIPESEIHTAGITGIKIKKAGQTDVRMFFDKSSGLVAGFSSEVPDDSGRLVTETMRYSDYRNFNGFRSPGKTEYSLGNNFYQVETVQYLQSLNANYEDVFNPPR